MPKVADLTFKVPESLTGKSFRELPIALPLDWYGVPYGKEGFDVGYETPLTAGQLLKFQTHDPTYQGSGQFRGLTSLLGAPLSTQQVTDVLTQQAQSARMKAIQPAVESLQASIPEIATKYLGEKQRLEAGKNPLKARYENIVAELKRRESVETQQASTTLSREYGRRGIPLSSGVFEQNLGETTRPISQFYGIQQKEVGLSQEEGLAGIDQLISNLTGAEVESVRAVRNTLGQLQAGAGEGAIQDAFNMLQFQEQQRVNSENIRLQEIQQELAKRELEQYKIPSLTSKTTTETTTPELKTEVVEVGGKKVLINKETGGVISTLGSSGTTSTGVSGTTGGGKADSFSITDESGNKFRVTTDKNGNIVSKTQTYWAPRATNQLKQQFGGGINLGQQFGNIWSWLNPFD